MQIKNRLRPLRDSLASIFFSIYQRCAFYHDKSQSAFFLKKLKWSTYRWTLGLSELQCYCCDSKSSNSFVKTFACALGKVNCAVLALLFLLEKNENKMAIRSCNFWLGILLKTLDYPIAIYIAKRLTQICII